jgi:hypothetical protein
MFRKLGLTILVAATIAISSQAALAIMIPEATRGVKWVDLESMRGRVTAVNPFTFTLVVASKGKSVTAVVNGHTAIDEWGIPEKFDDVKVGDRVSMLYEGTNHKWVADRINIRPSIPSMSVEGPDVR